MLHGKKTLTLAAAATGAVLAAGMPAAVGTPHVHSQLIKTPHLTITMSGKSSMHVKGPKRFSAGRISVTLIAKKGEQEVGFFRLHKGYTYRDAGRDFATFFSADGPPNATQLAALNRVAHRVSFYGGLDSGSGHKTVRATIVLPRAGRYIVVDDNTGPGVVPPVTLHVTKREGTRATPHSDAFVKAVTAKRFRGDTTLPAKGTITFKNASINSPHFLALQHVKKGTTRREIIKAFNSGPGSGGPNPFLDGSVGTDVVGPGQSQTLTYSLPAGTYVEACFFPDLQTGMPHAMMGMVRIVHLK